MKRSDLNLAVMAGLAIVTLATSVLGLIALNTGGEAAFGPITLMRLGTGYDRRAEADLAGPNLPTAQQRREAVRLSQEALHQYPYDTSDWLRLAYVDSLDHHGLTPMGLSYLQRSYDLVAVDSYVGLWRIRFALDNSQALTPEVRAAVRNEVTALWKNGEDRNPLRDMRTSVLNPAGRLSIALWLNRLGDGVAE